MIERHVSFRVKPDRTADFERFFAERYLPPAQEMPGLIGCILLVQADAPEQYQMVFRWDTAEQAAAWRTSPAHEALQPDLQALHDGMEITAYRQVA